MDTEAVYSRLDFVPQVLGGLIQGSEKLVGVFGTQEDSRVQTGSDYSTRLFDFGVKGFQTFLNTLQFILYI